MAVSDGGPATPSEDFDAWVKGVPVGALPGVLSLFLGIGGAEACGLAGALMPVVGEVAADGAATDAVPETVAGAGVERRHAHPVPFRMISDPMHREVTRTRPLGLRVVIVVQKKADWASGGIGLPA